MHAIAVRLMRFHCGEYSPISVRLKKGLTGQTSKLLFETRLDDDTSLVEPFA